MNRIIKSVAVLGSGVMGSRIACHFANIGVNVLLLDVCPRELSDSEKKKNLTLQDKSVRNRIVNDFLQVAIKSNPSPLYKKEFHKRIQTGNFEDNMKDISETDWIIEVVVENLEIKKSIFDEVEKYRKPGTIVSSNTSGIPIRLMCEGRSEDFQQNFLGTHFFNPPRYLELLEIIPSVKTNSELIDFVERYGDLYLGKTVVVCKDTPGFIANRIGIFVILDLFHSMEEMNLSVEEMDTLTGPLIGRPKSATCRTTDVVGLDTMVKVADYLYNVLKEDYSRDIFKLPGFISEMYKNKWLGDKTGQGFYKKVKTSEGKTEIHSLDLKTFNYQTQKKSRFSSLENIRILDELNQRIKGLMLVKDTPGILFRKSMYNLFEYVADKIPEISDDLYKIDLAVKKGFGWEMGPFEIWDTLDVNTIITNLEKEGKRVALWVKEMVKKHTHFYTIINGKKHYYDIPSNSYKLIPGTSSYILLNDLRKEKVIKKNSGASLFDIGDGVLNLEFHTKMNALGGEIISMLNESIDLAEREGWQGLVIGNQSPNFSAGANLALLLMYAIEQEWEEIDSMIRAFQKSMMRVKYSAIPVVVAPHGLTLGGGCEMCLHADRLQASAETYIGLVEVGVGLIPGGGGTKEMVLRASDSYRDGDIELNTLRNNFLNIAMAKVSTSAYEGFEIGVFRRGDEISINKNRQIHDAKMQILEMRNRGYTKPTERKDIKVHGKSALGMFLAGTHAMLTGRYISEHDKKITEKLAWVMCGGDLSTPTYVSEQYLLDLEREVFLSLCGEKKTLERIQSVLNTGKPLRN